MENLISVKMNTVFHMLQGNGEYVYLGGFPGSSVVKNPPAM